MACTFACTSFFTKALFCQNKDHFDIPVNIPTIGLDPILDSCLCVQGNVESMHSCASCRAKNNVTVGDATWVFLDACNKEFPDRHLWLPNAASSSLKPWGFHSTSSLDQLSPSWNRKISLPRKLFHTLNLYSVLLTFSLAVTVCSYTI